MNHPLLAKEVQKRCERCDNVFFIPNIKQSSAREILLYYTPCPHCQYAPQPKYPKNRDGRCADCSISFTVIDYKAMGRCERCYKRYSRGQKGGDLLGS